MTTNDHDKLIKLTDHLNEIKNYHIYQQNFSSIGELIDKHENQKPWCEKHLKGRWYNYFSVWYFEKEDDYTLFLLRWS